MSTRFEQLAIRIFETLKGYGYTLNVYDEEGNKIFVPRNGRAFFSQNEELAVYIFENGIDSDIKIFLSGDDVDPFLKLLTNLRKTAIKYRVNFTVRKYGGSIKPKDFAFMAADIVSEGSDSMEYKLDEGMTGTSKTSYQKIGETRLVIKHTAPVKETHGSRGRNIKAIFIETPDGERLKYPYNHLLGARAMARHISNEGSMRDSFGERIIGLSEDIRDLTKIGNHIWRTRGDLAESSLEFRLVAREKVSTYKKTLESLCRLRGYETTKSILEEDDTEKLPDQNTMDKMREMLKLEENNEFDQALAKLAIIVKEAESDPMDLEAPSEPVNRGFTDIDAGEADEYVDAMRQDMKNLDSEEVAALGDTNAKIIRNAMGFTAGGDFANIKMDELRATAADPLVPGAEKWTEYKPVWDTIIKNGAPWGNPSNADWGRLQEMQEWVESLNKNLVGADIKNIVLGAILIRISSALYSVMDKTLPAFDIIGAPFQKYLVPFFNLISGETVMETKTTGMPEEEQLNDWFDSFDPDRFLATRKSQYANTITKKAKIIKENYGHATTAGVELLPGLTDDENKLIRDILSDDVQVASAAQTMYDNNDELRYKLFDMFQEEMPYGIQKARTGDPDEWIFDHLDAMFNPKIYETKKRSLSENQIWIAANKLAKDSKNKRLVKNYHNAFTADDFQKVMEAVRDTFKEELATKVIEDAKRILKKKVDESGPIDPRDSETQIAQQILDHFNGDANKAMAFISHKFEMEEVTRNYQEPNWEAVSYGLSNLVDPHGDFEWIGATPVETGPAEFEMDEMEQGEESSITIKQDAHDSLIKDIEFDADDPSELPFKDELVGDMYMEDVKKGEISRASDIRHILNQIENI